MGTRDEQAYLHFHINWIMHLLNQMVQEISKWETEQTNTTEGEAQMFEDNDRVACEGCVWEGVAYWINDSTPVAQWVSCDVCDWGNK